MVSFRARKGPSPMQWLVFTVGLLIMAFGIVLMIKADLGSAPWDVLHIGLYYHFGLTIGTWSIIVGFFILASASLLSKSLPQLGAFLNMLFVGIFIDMYLLIPFLQTPSTLLGSVVMLGMGIIIIGIGIGVYISAKCGAGPRDSLMLVLMEKTGLKVQWIRFIMEMVVLFFGWLLGGPIFLGTIIFSISIGSVVGITLPISQKYTDKLLNKEVGKLPQIHHEM